MSLKNKSTIFDSPAQRLAGEIDPATIRLIEDRLLIRELPEPDWQQIGSIVIPQTVEHTRGAGKQGLYRFGEVLAVGPGNRFIECGFDPDGGVRRRLIGIPCKYCYVITEETECTCQYPDLDEVCPYRYPREDCAVCRGTGFNKVQPPPECRMGDIVIYDRRKDCEFYVNGERLSLVYEEQSVVMIVKRAE